MCMNTYEPCRGKTCLNDKKIDFHFLALSDSAFFSDSNDTNHAALRWIEIIVMPFIYWMV